MPAPLPALPARDQTAWLTKDPTISIDHDIAHVEYVRVFKEVVG